MATKPTAEQPTIKPKGKPRGPNAGPGAIAANISETEQELARYDRAVKVWAARQRGFMWQQVCQVVGVGMSTAKEDLRWLLRQGHQDDILAMREETSARYDVLIGKWWDPACKGDWHAASRVLAAMAQQATLLGLNRPIEGDTIGGFDEALRQFEQLLAAESVND